MAEFIGFYEYIEGYLTIEPNPGWDTPIEVIYGDHAVIVDSLRFRVDGVNLVFEDNYVVGQLQKGDVFRFVP